MSKPSFRYGAGVTRAPVTMMGDGSHNMGGTVARQNSGEHGADRVTRYRRGEDEPPSVAVVNAIAEVQGVDAAAVAPTLHEQTDPDALDSLFADRLDGTPRSTGQVVLRIDDLEVVVQARGDVLVRR